MTEEEIKAKDEYFHRLDMMDSYGETYKPFERWNQLSPSEEKGEQEFKQ